MKKYSASDTIEIADNSPSFMYVKDGIVHICYAESSFATMDIGSEDDFEADESVDLNNSGSPVV